MATTAGASVPSYGISPSPETGGGSSEPCIVEEWLKTLNLARYAESFVDNGYDDLEICKQIGEPDLDAIGVSDPSHRQTILRAVRLLLEHGATAVYFTLEECQTQREDCQQRDSTCLDAAKLDLEGADNYACEFGVNSGGESPPGNFAAANTFSRINRKYNDEYEEGKAELVRFPKLQLKVFVREKLIRDGIRLSSFPYTNADGSRGHLETLAVRYAHELRTHYQDVLERLEEVRRRRVAIDVVPYPSLNQQVEETYGRIKPLYKPGKYSPSSCLSDQEEETIYDNNYCSAIFRANNTAAPTINNCKSTNVASSPHTQRCISPRSKLFYEPCPTEVRENGDNCVGEHSKKHRSGVTSGVLSGVGGGGLGKLFRSLGTKKDKGLSPKHKGSSAQISKASNYGFTLKLGGGHHTAAVPSAPGATVDVNARAYQHAEISEPLVGDEERVQLLRMVRDGYLTMEEAVQKIRSRQAELAKDRKYPEVIAELTRGGLWGPGGRKTQPKPSSVFYSDQLNIPRSDPSLVEEGHETPLHHSASLINASGHHVTAAEPSELLDRLSLRHHSPNPPLQKLPHYSSATLGTPSRRNTSATLERGTPPPRTFTQEEFAATVLARTRVTLGQRLSSSGETREPCSGECGNIMCSLSAATDEDSLIERPTDGERGSAMTENGGNGSVVVCPGGEISPSSVDEPRFRSLSGVGEEGTAVTSDQPPPSEESNCFMIRERAPANSKSSTDGAGDYASSPVMERRSKSGVLGKFRNLTNRSSYSTSEEGHSQSSDCEDLDESRFSPRDSNNRASTTSFAGKVRDLHRDVKRRFGKLRGSSRSGDNENNRENGEAPIEGGSSMESIPSGSGGSRSSLQAHTPTSSNRSSSSAGEDETASVIGPILGRARALVDVTPSPYDRDALGLKKGDIIDIIAKNNTGTWVGVVKGKVGHFKFINVEEIAVESRARRRRRKERFNPARDNNLANSNSEQGYQDSLASPANERWQPETLEQLLNHFGLQGCMNVLMLHGYEDLNTFREIEKEDLSSLGITSPSLQKRLLRAAEVLFDDDEIDEGDEITNLENEDAIVENGNNRHSNEVVLSTNNLDAIDTGFVLSNFSSSSTSRQEVDDQSLSQDVREERQSDVPHSPRPSDFRPNIPASEPSSNERFATDENGIASSTIAFVASSQDELVSTDSGQGDSGESVRGSLRTAAKMLKASSICSVSGYDSEGSLSYSVRMEDFDFGRPDARMEIKNSKGKVPPPIPKRTTPTVVRPSKFPNGTVEVNCNGDAMVSYLYQDHDGYGIMVDSRAAKGVKSATLPRKKLMDANDSNQQQTQHSSSVVQEKVEHHGGSKLLEKKLYKKFGQRKGSLQTQALKNPRPPSLSLLTAVYRKLEDEGIDLGQEPYTDKTGFCGIPPALVQRYAEELQRDIYDVAESMDQARINSLQMRGRRGVPNDFLADACYGPVVEANYSGSLREWLISLGLPMYEEHLRLACMNRGLSHPLEKVAILRDSDLRNFGIRNARHVRLLTTAIGALNIHLGRLGGLC